MALLNKLRLDARNTVHEQPTWITSRRCGIECDSVPTVLFQFPKTLYGVAIYVHAMFAYIHTAFSDAGADILVGLGTVPTYGFNETASVTPVNADEYFATGEMTLTLGALTAAAGSFNGTQDAPVVNSTFIACADTTMPVIYMSMDATAAMVGTGVVEINALVSRIPIGR